MSNSKLIFDAVHDYNASIDPKPKQIEAFEYFLAGKDVIVNLPVGYGKSLVYHVLPKLVQRATPDLEKLVILTISPLNIIQTEQIDVLKRHNISACSLPYLDNEESLDSDLNHSIVSGDFAVVFAHPEALLNTSKG
ncbi:uncharacterized protein LOC128552334 [Mercenaria mercenaria]|uniref:uncharacterized protein LOC128552334 n=1 Tax=Mercenaria mercenaria TaxID=6596 RepID=UPI00234ED05F|nr:uncharacterized protein LOC128552334 [Mercenaria mercenaria]